ncbi:MAG: LOG family protein [Acidimicrobiia bacterium]
MSDSSAVAVFGSSQTDPDSRKWAEAERVGRRLAEAGLAVITGGYGGTMEAVSKGTSEAGGHVIGVTAPPLFLGRHGANPYVAELIETEGLTRRIGAMMERAAGTIALPGSIGTATELLIAWNVNHIVRRNGGHHVPTVAVGREWRTVVETLVSEVDAFPGDIHLASTSDEGVDWMLEQLKNH